MHVRAWAAVAMLWAGLIPAMAAPGAGGVTNRLDGWKFDMHPYRMVCYDKRQGNDIVLVRVPDVEGRAIGSVRATDDKGTDLWARVACRVGGATLVQVSRGELASLNPNIHVYFVPGGEDAAGGAWADEFDKVGVDLYQAASPTIPLSWERYAYFFMRKGRLLGRATQADFSLRDCLAIRDELAIAGGKLPPRRRGDPGRIAKGGPWGHLMARLQSVVTVAEDGEYRMALRYDNSAYVRVDDREVLDFRTAVSNAGWSVGPAFAMKAGLHTFEVFSASVKPQVTLGWIRPGMTEVEEVPAAMLLGPWQPIEGRLERMNAAVNPGVASELVEAYRFRGAPDEFFNMKLSDNTRNTLGGVLSRRWTVEGETNEAPSWMKVMVGRGPHEVAFEIGAGTGGGDRLADVVMCEADFLTEYAVSFACEPGAAVVYEGDAVEPVVVCRGKGPAGAMFGLSWTWTLRGGETVSGLTNLALGGTAMTVGLGKRRASEVESVSWAVRHGGVTLEQGRVSVARAPFAVWPAAVEGSRFEDGAGGQVILESNPEGRRKMVIERLNGATPPPGIVCVDDVLVPQGLPAEFLGVPYDQALARLVKDAGVESVVRRSLSPDSAAEEPGEGHLVRLLEATRLGGGETGAVILVSVGLQDLLRGVGPTAYERQLSVVCDRLLEQGCRRVVLVTPPPYPTLDAELRACAIAVRRVAGARRIPVADVFTGMRGMGEGERLFFPDHNLALTARGHRLAAQIMMRTLMEENLIRPEEGNGSASMRTSVDFTCEFLPAVAFETDVLEPVIAGRGVCADAEPFSVAWTWALRGGGSVSGQTQVVLGGAEVAIGLGRRRAAEVESVAWTVSRAGAVIRQERVVVVRPPFPAWPVAVSGGGFVDAAGGRLILVTNEDGSSVGAGVPDKALPGSVVCIDDALAPRGLPVESAAYDRLLVKQMAAAGVTDVGLRSLSTTVARPEADGGHLVRFLDVARLGAVETGAVLVVSVGLQDLLAGVGPAVFERQLAVLCDRLSGAGRRLVLVTPPAYPHFETDARAFAVAVRRVGLARGVAVADVFSGVRDTAAGGRMFDAVHNLVLTARGQGCVAHVIGQALTARGAATVGADAKRGDFFCESVSPVMYEDDILAPSIVAGGGRIAEPHSVLWTWRLRDGSSVSGEALVGAGGVDAGVELGRHRVSQVDGITWSVRKADAVVRQGCVKLARMPFAAWPAAVSGGGFDDGAGGQVVLVTSPEVRQGALAAGSGKEPVGSILWIDDVLVSGALHVVQPAVECDRVLAELGKDGGVGDVRRRVLSTDEALSGDGDGALGRLLETVRSGSAATGSAVVVSVGLQDFLRGVGPGVFERQLSVVCERLRMTGAGRLVLVTPPPYPHLEDGLKAFAVAVRRVAVAQGVPVADVYTGVMGARGGTPVFAADHNLALTSYGHRLVAQVVARTLAEEGVSAAGARERQVLW